MSTIHFQISSIYNFTNGLTITDHFKENYMKQIVEKCGGTLLKWNILKKNTRKANSKPILEKQIIDVTCLHSKKETTLLFCAKLRKEWSLLNNKFLDCSSELIPWLTFLENKCFSNQIVTSHDVEIQEFSLGTLVWPSLVILHFNFIDGKEQCKGSFYHDLKFINILLNDYKIKILYNDIRDILVHEENGIMKMFLVLINPISILKKNDRLKKKKFWSRIVNYPRLSKHVLGSSNVILLTFNNVKLCWEIVSRMHFRCKKMPINCVKMTIRFGIPTKCMPEVNEINFNCGYLITGLAFRNFVLHYQYKCISSFMLETEYYINRDTEILEKVLVDIIHNIDQGLIFDYRTAIKVLFEWYITMKNNDMIEQFIIPPSTKLVRRITITPTRVLFWPAEVIFENRILRNFNPDYALRVSFRDDNLKKLNSNCSPEDGIYDSAIRIPMSKGILIGERKFEFLAWSNSQIREHSVWFYAKDDKGCCAADVRAWMGNFSNIKNVSTFMSRMGQCFSQSKDTISVPLDESYIRTEDDIEGGINPITNKPYCFSDGTGKISINLATEVCKALDIKAIRSAYQIRYAGYKGMLTVDPQLKDVDIVFRKSMKKFDCPSSNKLEIVKTSNPVSVQLNRPLITILDNMGIDGNIFEQMLQDILTNLTSIFIEEDKAANYLKTKLPFNLIDFNILIYSGIRLTTEHFFRSLLLSVHRLDIVKLKNKARLNIDPSEGRNMFGVLDEYGLLEYGQVFVQYSEEIIENSQNGTNRTKILEGDVLVTKNPCLQPGDVRILQAVNIPELHHIIDCIVFPQRGSRPHPNEMAGSDLDGDEYTVIWKKDLLFPKENNAAPMHFPSPIKKKLSHDINLEDMIECLVNYIKNDMVGRIGTAHLVTADSLGLFSEECKVLAEKFSIAVDFAKSGHAAMLNSSEKPSSYPDFMEKTSYFESYKSNKILGKLYRITKGFEKINEIASFHYYNIEIDKDLIYPGWENYLESAFQVRNKYNSLLQNIMQNYGIEYEAEAISGNFIPISTRYNEREITELEDIVKLFVKTLWENMNREFHKEFFQKDKSNSSEIYINYLQKASAWYVVTYCDKNSKYFSFPWIVSKYLSAIKLMNMKEKCNIICFTPVISKLDEILQNLILKQNRSSDHENSCNKIRFSKVINNYFFNMSSKLLSKEIKKAYVFLIPQIEVEIVLSLILEWAEHKSITKPLMKNFQKHIFPEDLVKLFVIVAKKEGYIKSNDELKKENRMKSPARLCLSFLKYCMSLRFKKNNDDNLPINIFNLKTELTKCATNAYHSIAITGTMDVFNLVMENYEPKDEEIEMEPQRLSKKIVESANMLNDNFFLAKKNLLKWTGTRDIQIRIHEGCAFVSATGNLLSVKMLEHLLAKNSKWLSEAFMTSRLPEHISPWNDEN